MVVRIDFVDLIRLVDQIVIMFRNKPYTFLRKPVFENIIDICVCLYNNKYKSQLCIETLCFQCIFNFLLYRRSLIFV